MLNSAICNLTHYWNTYIEKLLLQKLGTSCLQHSTFVLKSPGHCWSLWYLAISSVCMSRFLYLKEILYSHYKLSHPRANSFLIRFLFFHHHPGNRWVVKFAFAVKEFLIFPGIDSNSLICLPSEGILENSCYFHWIVHILISMFQLFDWSRCFTFIYLCNISFFTCVANPSVSYIISVA